MRVVQITDTHLMAEPGGRMAGMDTAASLERVLDHVAARTPPDLLLVTGDIAQQPLASAYRRFADQLARFDVPVVCVPGNHDDPHLLRGVLTPRGYQIGGARALQGWLIVALDSHAPGQAGGVLGSAELQCLSDALQQHPGLPALVALHHPPVAIDSPWLDAMGLADSEAFMAAVLSQTRIKAVVWGHIHQCFEATRGQLKLLASPSTCVQFQPGAADYTLDPLPPGYRWFELDGNGGLRSGVTRVPDA